MKDIPGQVTQDDQVDEFGHVRLGGIGEIVGAEIERRAGIETRVTILGYIQRGGSPTPYDRVLATRYGVTAADLVHEGEFGTMVALKGSKIESVPLAEVTGRIRTVDMELYDIAQVFFG
jgi:6-phosphofructokinase 1